MALLYILLTAGSLLAGLYFLMQLMGPKRCNIPGPMGLPYVGVSPFITSAPYTYFTNLSKKYGDLFCCKIDRCDIVFLNSFELVEEFFRKKAEFYQDKYCYFPETLDIPVGFGEVHYGPRMLELRDFGVKALSDRNAGKGTYDDLVNDEVSKFCEYVTEKYGTTAIDPFIATRKCFSNILMTFLVQKRYDYCGDELGELFEAVENVVLSMHPHFFFKHKTELKLRKKLNMYPSQLIERNEDGKRKVSRRAFAEVDTYLAQDTAGKDRGHCFLDRFWNAINEKKALGEKTFLTKNSMKGVLSNFMGAGMHSTSIVATWIEKILTRNQDVQKKVKEEIFTMIGRNQLPKLADKKDMHYTNAFLQECERFISLAPIGIPHTSAKDSTYKGYFIPKGTYIFSNLWAIHFDEKLFPEPFEFRPERYIDDAGNFMRSKYVNIFGIGKRSCPGQVFVQREMFLFIAQLLQKFDLKPPEGVPAEELLLKGKFDGHGFLPPSFKIRLCPVLPQSTD